MSHLLVTITFELDTYERDAGEPIVVGLVDFVFAQTARRYSGLGDVGRGVGALLHGPLERRRQSGREANQVDGHDDAPGPRFGAQHSPANRVAHGDVALHGERHCQPHRSVGCNDNKFHFDKRLYVQQLLVPLTAAAEITKTPFLLFLPRCVTNLTTPGSARFCATNPLFIFSTSRMHFLLRSIGQLRLYGKFGRVHPNLRPTSLK